MTPPIDYSKKAMLDKMQALLGVDLLLDSGDVSYENDLWDVESVKEALDALNAWVDAIDGDFTIGLGGEAAIGAGKVTSAMLGPDVGLVVSASGGKTMTRNENIAGLSSAITLANEVRGDLISHFANATRHPTGQQSTAAINDEADDNASLLALTGNLLSLYAAHNTDAVLAAAWSYHTAQAKACALVSAVTPVSLQEAVTRLNDLKAKFNDHEDEAVGHDGQASVVADQVAASDAAYGVANAVPMAALPGDVVFWSILNDGTGNVTGVSAVAGTDEVVFTFSGDPQNDCIISYMLVRPAA
jgi:hypothetical protein